VLDEVTPALNAYNQLAQSGDAVYLFKTVIRSLLTGNLKDLPEPLHELLIFECINGERKLRWDQCYFMHFLTHASPLDNQLADIRDALIMPFDKKI
jgi:hypothetical protein